LRSAFFAGSRGAQVTVPNVVGMTQASAVSAIMAQNLGYSIASEYSSAVAAGTVIRQSLAAGSAANAGAIVTITVSIGPQPTA